MVRSLTGLDLTENALARVGRVICDWRQFLAEGDIWKCVDSVTKTHFFSKRIFFHL